MISPILGLPRVSVANHAPTRRVFRQVDFETGLTGGKVIDGTKTRDTGSADNTGWLRPGLLMGKISASKKYANAVLGLSQGALTAAGTTLTTNAAIATEIVRRIGATGTFKMTGPTTAAGTVRTLTVTYSAVNVTTGDVTITAAGVNEVQTLTPTGDASAGSWTIEITRADGSLWTTGPLAYSASIATIQTALDIATGVANGIVVAGSGAPVDVPNAMTLTFSGTGYASLPFDLVRVNAGTSITANTGWNVARTTAGVDGRFVTNSLIQPTDGSETPLTILPDSWNWDIIDPITGSGVDTVFGAGRFPIAGIVESAQLLPWPADTSLRTWIKAALRNIGQFVFDDGY